MGYICNKPQLHLFSQRSPPPSYHSAEDNISHQRMTNGYAESSTHEEGTNAFSALDDAVAGFTSNDDTQSHVAPSLNESRPSSVAPNAHAPAQLTNGIMNEDSDTESDVNRNRDESSNISDIESDVQRNSNALENGDMIPTIREVVAKSQVIVLPRQNQVVKRAPRL